MRRRDSLKQIGAVGLTAALLPVTPLLVNAQEADVDKVSKPTASTPKARGLSTTKLPEFLDVPLALPDLPYDYDALAPVIDKETMMLHHDKHHAGYLKKLVAALDSLPELKKRSLAALLADLAAVPESVRLAVRNHGGGHLNHSLFWSVMTSPNRSPMSEKLAGVLAKAFGTVDRFKQLFADAGTGMFGSGWVWLVLSSGGELEIVTTPNQDSPISEGLIPLLGNDVWEHAYYLNYRNDRAAYLAAWWQVVNWNAVEQRYEEIV